jgi:hypothetical protein
MTGGYETRKMLCKERRKMRVDCSLSTLAWIKPLFVNATPTAPITRLFAGKSVRM